MPDTYCPQGWPERSPGHRTPVCQSVGHWVACPGSEKLLWVSGYNLKHNLSKKARTKEERKMRAKEGDNKEQKILDKPYLL